MRFSNGGELVTRIEDLPDLRHVDTLVADFETSSGDPKQKSINPWKHCFPLGIAVKDHASSRSWYVPVGHHDRSWNLPYESVRRWWCDVLDTAGRWVNHNIKYDAHVSTNCMGVMPREDLPLVDTLTMAKLFDSDRMRYGLDHLSRDWLGEDISRYEAAFAPYLHKNKDYGKIPADIMGEYACQDVVTESKLYTFLEKRIPEDVMGVWNTEQRLTRVLYDIEREGMRVTPDLIVHQYKTLTRMLELDEELEQIVGRPFRANVNQDCFEVLCVQYGLPVLGWTQGKKLADGSVQRDPSFDKDAMAGYSAHPLAPQDVVKRIIEYRKLATLHTFFIKPYSELMDEDRMMHPSYNQCLRTGRLACSSPNAQQLSKEAKKLIVPRPGESFLSIDYSQIEFRLMMHYINDRNAIEAYVRDPDVDFHSLVAEWCEIKRRPAKTINFGIGFGMGKKKTVASLAANEDLVGAFKEAILREIGDENSEKFRERFQAMAEKRGVEVFEKYHHTFPTLRPTSNRAGDAARRRGYVFNLYGRRRHLPPEVAHIAFNTLNQGTAADMMKERSVEVHDMLKGTPIRIVASVHDELLMTGPTEVIRDQRTIYDIVSVMEQPTIMDRLRVPIRCSYGLSDTTWADADDELRVPFRYESRRLEHLR